ncbi:MAG TPA: DUF5777 family beta-barrel protein [Chitinophagaceae bacterium]|nr:DUF5777 family beta-barrel protein [Chitinophagaceae bacterium]HNF72010.1 DUF5777 family beta-barrel protein [Chitinophagaceae bacterium]
MKKIYLILSSFLWAPSAWSQTETNDLDKLLDGDQKPHKEFVRYAFKSPRVINGHSIEMLGKGVLDFRILHRFGTIDGGIGEMFGLDQASMRYGFDYGVTRNLTLGAGRSTLSKEIDGFIKYRIVQQSKGPGSFPLSIVWVSGTTLKTTKIENPELSKMVNRLAYYHELLVGRKLGSNFTLQLAPILVHRNLVEFNTDKNSMLALGIGGRMKISNRTALILDTYPILYGARSGYNVFPLSLGVDIETGGHIFQLHITNARGMNEKAFVAETTQHWDEGQIMLGFNLSRVFTVVQNKETSW